MPHQPGATDVVLQAVGLTKRYGDLTAVDDLSFEVRRGEILGFLGPNGAGKTTTLKMLCGLLRPDKGQIILHGRPLDPSSADAIRSIGIAPQATVIWDAFEVEVGDDAGPDLATFVAELRSRLPSLTADGRTLRFTSPDAARVLPSMFAAIRDRGFRVVHLRVRERTLEDVFIHLTGRGLRE
jgi:ABC transporter